MEENKKPFVVEVEPGTYYWCSCGRSNDMPRCDGSHVGTEFTPHVATITEKTTVAICSCGQAKNKIYCDGSHNNTSK